MVAPEPTSRLIAELPSASKRLLDTVTQLPDNSVLRPSLLPGWSLGHVLTHVARNADALVKLCDWALTGVRKPMYVSVEAREAPPTYRLPPGTRCSSTRPLGGPATSP